MRDVVVRSRVKSDGRLMANTGTEEVGEGGIIEIWKANQLGMLGCIVVHHTRDSNRDRDIVNETGRRANDGTG